MWCPPPRSSRHAPGAAAGLCVHSALGSDELLNYEQNKYPQPPPPLPQTKRRVHRGSVDSLCVVILWWQHCVKYVFSKPGSREGESGSSVLWAAQGGAGVVYGALLICTGGVAGRGGAQGVAHSSGTEISWLNLVYHLLVCSSNRTYCGPHMNNIRTIKDHPVKKNILQNILKWTEVFKNDETV